MPTVSSQADGARAATVARSGELGGDVLHPAVGVATLAVVLVLNVHKPRGSTAHGRRRQHEHDARQRGAVAP